MTAYKCLHIRSDPEYMFTFMLIELFYNLKEIISKIILFKFRKLFWYRGTGIRLKIGVKQNIP